MCEYAGCRASVATATARFHLKGIGNRRFGPLGRCGRAGRAGDTGGRRELDASWEFPLEFGFPPRRFTQGDTDRAGGCRVTQELNVLALIKGDERFIFVYDDDSTDTLIEDIRNQAADPAVALNWFDAAVLTERVRNPAGAPDPSHLLDD